MSYKKYYIYFKKLQHRQVRFSFIFNTSNECGIRRSRTLDKSYTRYLYIFHIILHADTFSADLFINSTYFVKLSNFTHNIFIVNIKQNMSIFYLNIMLINKCVYCYINSHMAGKQEYCSLCKSRITGGESLIIKTQAGNLKCTLYFIKTKMFS